MSQVLIPTTNGALYFFGPRPARDQNVPALIHNEDNEQTLEIYFDYSNLPTPGTSPAFIAGSGIPAGSIITFAYFFVVVAFAGGTSYDIGLSAVNGTPIDADGLWDNLLLASIDAVGEAGVSSGALINAQIAVEGFPVVANTGTFTAGLMQLLVKFIPPVTVPNE